MEQTEWIKVLEKQIADLQQDIGSKEDELAEIQRVIRPLQEKREHLIALIELETTKTEGPQTTPVIELPIGLSAGLGALAYRALHEKVPLRLRDLADEIELMGEKVELPSLAIALRRNSKFFEKVAGRHWQIRSLKGEAPEGASEDSGHVAELVDAEALGVSAVNPREGSNPSVPTT